jgi:hypothetical protein
MERVVQLEEEAELDPVALEMVTVMVLVLTMILMI